MAHFLKAPFESLIRIDIDNRQLRKHHSYARESSLSPIYGRLHRKDRDNELGDGPEQSHLRLQLLKSGLGFPQKGTLGHQRFWLKRPEAGKPAGKGVAGVGVAYGFLTCNPAREEQRQQEQVPKHSHCQDGG